MPLSDTDLSDDRIDAYVEILDQVVLRSFTATPDHIGPFGSSHLAWSVEGPPGGFRVTLNGVTVQRSGGRIVMPASTSSYRLRAVAGPASRTLGSVTVTVDTTGCVAYEPLLKPTITLAAALANGVQAAAVPGLSLRSPPAVSFAPGTITFALRLEQSIDWFPNVSIDIDASFGLAVADGALVAVGEAISADASVPWYAWGVPGAIPGLAVALDGAKTRARKAGRDAVTGLLELLNALSAPPSGTRMQTVRIDSGNGGFGVIEITACPDDLLRRLAAISEVGVVR